MANLSGAGYVEMHRDWACARPYRHHHSTDRRPRNTGPNRRGERAANAEVWPRCRMIPGPPRDSYRQDLSLAKGREPTEISEQAFTRMGKIVLRTLIVPAEEGLWTHETKHLWNSGQAPPRPKFRCKLDSFPPPKSDCHISDGVLAPLGVLIALTVVSAVWGSLDLREEGLYDVQQCRPDSTQRPTRTATTRLLLCQPSQSQLREVGPQAPVSPCPKASTVTPCARFERSSGLCLPTGATKGPSSSSMGKMALTSKSLAPSRHGQAVLASSHPKGRPSQRENIAVPLPSHASKSHGIYRSPVLGRPSGLPFPG